MVSDRRVRRTRQLLRSSLVSLILERGYERLTVQDIIDRADVGRSTFYAHYTDKDDLLLSGLEELASAFEDHMDRHFASRGEPNPVLAIFQHAEQQRDLYKALAGKRGAEVMRAGLRRRVGEVTARRVHHFLPEDGGSVPTPVVLEFLLSSMFGLLTWWLDNDLPHSPERMADMYMRLAVPGIQSVYLADSPDLFGNARTADSVD
ncbi:TetR/AcrR family transcriptional regulator [Nonomuraea sp. NPDC050556]|uniref:TetR/AcrR family transcriptional regulator n=1 Tax=Nonomuraea sp. NPDC050556 TaxID=3364369 RepID=UPI0037A82E57